MLKPYAAVFIIPPIHYLLLSFKFESSELDGYNMYNRECSQCTLYLWVCMLASRCLHRVQETILMK